MLTDIDEILGAVWRALLGEHLDELLLDLLRAVAWLLKEHGRRPDLPFEAPPEGRLGPQLNRRQLEGEALKRELRQPRLLHLLCRSQGLRRLPQRVEFEQPANKQAGGP